MIDFRLSMETQNMPVFKAKERPIIFSGAMVRSILADEKTQTRRVIKPQPEYTDTQRRKLVPLEAMPADRQRYFADELARKECPYGQPGDRLWVRETWAEGFSIHVSHRGVLYKATAAQDYSHHGYWAKEIAPNSWIDHYDRAFNWRPSIFMPRDHARIILEITAIRVERLQDISETDILAEGVTVNRVAEWCNYPWSDMPTLHHAWRVLWDSINGKSYPWESNPWVWAITFKKLKL